MDWNLVLYIALVIVGFVLLIFGGDWFVDGAVWIAEKAKIPPLLVGATIVSIGTTLPEIMVSLLSASSGDVGMAASNAIGSVLCNTTLILGIAFVATNTFVNKNDFISRIFFLLATVALLTVFSLTKKSVSVFECIVLIILFVAYIAYNVYDAVKKMKKPTTVKVDGSKDNFIEQEKPENKTEETEEKKNWKDTPYMKILFFFLGLVGVVLGAKLLVDYISIIAQDYLHIPTTVVGFTVVALGTSLPELITSINAVKKKEVGLSIGNVLGANIIDGSLLVGATYLVGGSVVMSSADINSILVGIGALAVASLLLCLPVMFKSRTYKWQGGALLATYVAYMVYLAVTMF